MTVRCTVQCMVRAESPKRRGCLARAAETKRRTCAGLGACAFALAWVALVPGSAAAGSRAELGFEFAQTHAGAPTALTLHILYRAPNDANAKPSPIRGAEIAAPAGTRFDTTARERCQATDAELMTMGRAACPAGSRVGGGSLVAITGFGAPIDPFVTDVTLFNTEGGVIELVQQRGTDETLAIDRATVRNNVYTSHPPRTPGGPPDGETAVRSVNFEFDAPSVGARAFITTPSSCSQHARWTATGRFTFDGGVDIADGSTPCQPSHPPPRTTHGLPGASHPRLRVAPTRVRRGRSRSYRLRLLGMPTGCRSGVLVRLGAQRSKTSATGLATLRAVLRRPGYHKVVASKRGCPTVKARVLVTA
jgi:hypothetical protein